MKSIDIHKKAVTSFDRCLADGDDNEGTADGGVYVFDVDCLLDKSAVVASTSDQYLTLHDSESFSQIRRIKAHTEMINGFDLSKTSSSFIFSASNDHRIHGWDLRVPGDLPMIKIKMSDEVTAVSVGINDSLLAAGCGSSITFYDIRGSNDWDNTKKASKLGEYSDIHTDTITQLRFSPANSQILASGAEDGLISLFNTSASDGDEAVVSIFNTECPIRRIGFFGVQDEAMYCLSTTETASFWHCATAQRVGDFPNIREELGADYLVDCFYDSFTDNLNMIAGNYDGSAKMAVVEPTLLRVIGELSGTGHSATIRCATSFKSNQNTRLITGGEDAKVCSWNITNESDRNLKDTKSSSNSLLKSGPGAAKKTERRQKPY